MIIIWHSSSIFWVLLVHQCHHKKKIHQVSLWNEGITRVQEFGLISEFKSGHLFGTGNPTSRWVVLFVFHLRICTLVGPFRNCPSFRAGSAQAVSTSRLEVWARWRLGLLPFLRGAYLQLYGWHHRRLRVGVPLLPDLLVRVPEWLRLHHTFLVYHTENRGVCPSWFWGRHSCWGPIPPPHTPRCKR